MLDPFVRLRTGDMQELRVVHLFSEWDDPASAAAASGIASGYTEWSTPGRSPSLSFAWDWTYLHATRRLEAHWRSLRTNVRVLGPDGAELSDEGTRLQVARLMTRAGWEQVVAEALGVPLDLPLPTRH
jgi:hypothetical protein